MQRRLNLALVLVIAALITYYSTRPLPAGLYASGVDFTLFYHGTAYFLLAGALLLYFHDTTTGHVEAVLFAAAFGAILELIQYGLPTRFFSFADMAINTLGASLILLDHRARIVSQIIAWEDTLLETIFS